MLVTVCGGRGAPGVSTLALGLAATWPRRRVVLVEADPAGAVLPYRLRGVDGEPLSLQSGLVQWAAACRTDAGADLMAHVQRIDGGLPVLVGPSGPLQAGAIGATWEVMAASMADPAGPVAIADVGRLVSAGGPASAVVAHAQIVVVAARANLEGAAALRQVLGVVAAIRGSKAPGGGLAGVHVVACEPRRAVVGGWWRRPVALEVEQVLAALPGLGEVPVAGVAPWDEATTRAWYEAGALPRRAGLPAACTQIATGLDLVARATVAAGGGADRVR